MTTLYTVKEGAAVRMVAAKNRAQAWAHVRQGIAMTATTPAEAAELTRAGVAVEDASGAPELRVEGEAA